MWRTFLIVTLMLSLFWTAFDSAEASPLFVTFTVDDTDDVGDETPGDGVCDAPGADTCTLRAAVEEANALAGDDDITLPAGTYTLTGTQLDVADNLTINGAGSGTTIIDAATASRVFEVTAAVTFTVNDTAMINGDAIGGDGGAIRSSIPGAELILNDSQVESSTAARGGGIFVFDGTLRLNNTMILNNTATATGGGLYFEDDATTTDVVALEILGGAIDTNNSASSGGLEVALANTSTALIDNGVLIVGNTATTAHGGGVILNNGTGTSQIQNSTVQGNISNGSTGGLIVRNATLSNMTIIDNTATTNTGGLYTEGTVQISLSTINNNTVTGPSGPPGPFGGGITNGAMVISNLTITESTINNNVVTDGSGGGIHHFLGTVTLNDVTIDGNTATNAGGGISIDNGGEVRVNNSTISNNSAINGAGILADNATLSVDNSAITGNQAQGGTGAGISAAESTITITNTTISNNSANNVPGPFRSGGGLGYSSLSANVSLTISGSTFANNTTIEEGGAIFIEGIAPANIVNTTLSGNSATVSGGGIHVEDAAAVTLNHLTLSGNTAPAGGGIFVDATASLNISNSIVTASGAGGDCAGAGTYTATNNLATPGECGAAADVTNLDPLANNGGPTQTHALLAGSNALDVVAVCGVTTDQRGIARISPCDIGAFELSTVPEIVVEDANGVPVVDIPDGGVYIFPAGTVAGTPITRTLTVRNIGGADLNLLTDPPTVTGDFGVTNFAATIIPPLGSTTFDLTCNATAAGSPNPVTGTVSFGNNDADENPFNFEVQCVVAVGPEPEIEVRDAANNDIPDDTGFFVFPAATTVGTPVTQTLTVRNTGTADLTLTNPPAVTGDFAVTNFTATTLAPNATATFDVTCNATTAGAPNAGTISFANNDPNENPFNFAVQCTVIAAPEIQVEDAGANVIPDNGTFTFPAPTTIGTPVTQTLTVRNTGTADLTLTNPPGVTGDFAVTNFAATTLAPNATTTFDVTCNATTPGNPVTGTITFANNDADENPYNFTVECVVNAPEIEVEDAGANPITDGGTFNFPGTTVVGTPVTQTITVRNTGTADLTLTNPPGVTGDFAVTNFAATTLAPNATTTFDITCNATTAGNPNTGTVTFNNTDPDENPFDFTVNCVVDPAPTPEIQVEDDAGTIITDGGAFTFTFSVPVGSSINEVITVRNIGTDDLTIATDPPTVTGTPGDFTAGNFGSLTVAPNTTTTFTLTCNGVTPGVQTATVSFDNNDADENPFNFTVNCNVTQNAEPEITVTDAAANNIADDGTFNFGATPVGVAVPHTFTVTNTGSADLTLVDPPTVTGDFTIGNFGATTLAVGATTTFTVTCNATAPGTAAGTVSFGNNDTNENPFNFTVNCDVVNPEIEVVDAGNNVITDGGVFNFPGATPVGTPITQTITVRNIGTQDLVITTDPPTPTGDFTAGNFSVLTIAPNATATFDLTCNATAPANPATGTVTFNNNDADENPFNFTINCIVIDPVNSADIEITKTVNSTTAVLTEEGGTLTFQITALNNGPADATNITIRDVLSANLTPGTIVASAGTNYDLGTGVWTIPSLVVNSTATLTIQATVNAGTQGTDIPNTAELLGLDQDDNIFTQNNTSTVSAHVTVPMVVTKQGFDLNGGNVQVGDTIGWIVCAINPDSVAASNVTITDVIDGTRLNAPATLNSGVQATCPAAAPVVGLNSQPNTTGNNLSVTLASVPAGQVGVLYFETTVRDPGMSNLPAFALTGLLALGGLFMYRPGRRKLFILLLVLLLVLLPVDTLYAQDDEGVATEEVTPEPPPLPFTGGESTPTATPTETPTPESGTPIEAGTATPIPSETPTFTPVETLIPTVQPTIDETVWMRYELSEPGITLNGTWETVVSETASGSNYFSTSDTGASLELVFEGERVRLGYLVGENYGIYEVYLDDLLVAAINGYSTEGNFVTTTEVTAHGPGVHHLRIQNTILLHPDATGNTLALDYVEIGGTLLIPTPGTPSETPSATPTASETPVESDTPTPTPEGTTATPTFTPEATATTPVPTVRPPAEGWTRFEMNHPDIQLSGGWESVTSEFVSGGSYIYSMNPDAALELEFEGEGVRFDYLQYWNFGIFEVYLDGTPVMTIDGYSPESRVGTSAEFVLQPGIHRLRIQNTGRRNDISEGAVIALDAIDIKNSPATPVPTPTAEPVEQGWTRYEMNHPSVELTGAWDELASDFVSGGSYAYSEEEDATATFTFTGDAVRLNYLEYFNFGIFEVYLNDEPVATIDSYNLESRGAATDTFTVEPGEHVLRIVNTGRTNADSAGIGLALDSIDVHEVELPTSTPTAVPPVSITGTVWIDRDNNGEGDQPAQNYPLNLYEDDGDAAFDAELDTLVGTLVVGDGNFEFEGLTSGSVYWLDAPETANPEWAALMIVAPGEVDILEPVLQGDTIETEIVGRVFNDNNANREWSGTGESGIRSAKVYLYSDDGDGAFDPDTDIELQSLQVKPDGTYIFENDLTPGTYWLWLDENSLPENYMDTVETGNHGFQNPKLLVIEESETPAEDEIEAAVITPEIEGETAIVRDANFAFTLDTDGDTSPDSIEGSGDRDNDGIPNYLDTFDPSGTIYSVDAAGNGNALAGAQIRLVYDNGGVMTPADTVQPNPQTTPANGGYRFDIVSGTANGLPAGVPRTFFLEIVSLPANYTFPSATFPPQATAFDASPVANSGQVVLFSHPPNQGQSHEFYMSFILQQGDDPVVNNHIAVDAGALPPNTLQINNTASARRDNNSAQPQASANITLNSDLNMTFAPNNLQTASPGQTITFNHTLTNTGTQSDRYTFSFPVGTQNGWTQQVQILRGTTVLGTINPGGTFTLPAANAVPPGGTLTVRHTATVPLGTANGTVNTNTITATSLNVAGNALSRTVTDVTTVQSGCLQGILFHDANNNTIRDTNEPVFPNARVIVSDNNNNPVATLITDANGQYSLAGLPGGIYNVRVDPASITGGAVVFLNPNTGTAQVSVNIGGTCATANFNLVLVDPALSKIGSVAQARPGENITFTLSLTNPSTSAITNVTVVDPLNGLLTFVSATATQGTSTFNSTNNTVTFNLGTVAPNATITMTINVTVSSLATPGTIINNTATLNYTEGPAETSPVVTITIPSPVTPTPTVTATVVGGATTTAGTGTTGGTGGGTGGGGGGTADTLPATGYRPFPTANTGLGFGWELGALSGMEIALMLLAFMVLVACIVWGVVQWMAEHRSDKLAHLLPSRPTPQLIRAVITIGLVSSMVLTMVFATNLVKAPEKQQQASEPQVEIADSSRFVGVAAEETLPITWQDSQGGFSFAPPQIPADRIIIPRLGIDTSLVNAPLVGTTWNVDELYDEVAHLDGTAFPGTMGNAVLAGHVQHQKGLGPFRNLSQLAKGDLIIAQGEDVEYTYMITDIMEVDPHAVEVTYPSNQPLITLISCTDWDNDTWSYTKRLVIRAQFKSWRHTDQEIAQETGEWRRYEVDGREVRLEGDWDKVDSQYTSDNSYVYSRDEDAEVTLSFSGEKLRLHYLYFPEFGIFDVYVDDEKVATIDAYNPVSLVGSSDIIFLEPGRHKLRIVNTGKRNESAKGITMALDAIDVYRAAEE